MWLLSLFVACLPASRRIPPPPVTPAAPGASIAAPAMAAALTGRVLELHGEAAAALAYYELALRYDAEDPWLLERRAAVIGGADSEPELAGTLAERGRARFLARDPDGAMLDLGAALRLRAVGAGWSEADLQIFAAAAVQSRRYGDALGLLGELAAARPGDVALAQTRAQLARDAGDLLAVRDALDALARLSVADAALQQERASLCLLLDDPRGVLSIRGPVGPAATDEAPSLPLDIRILALEGRTDIASQVQLAALRAEAGQVDLALATWEAVLAQDPGNPSANLGLGEVLLAGNRPDLSARALGHARRAANAAPGCADVWDLLQRAAIAADQPAEAELARHRLELYSGPWSRCP